MVRAEQLGKIIKLNCADIGASPQILTNKRATATDTPATRGQGVGLPVDNLPTPFNFCADLYCTPQINILTKVKLPVYARNVRFDILCK